MDIGKVTLQHLHDTAARVRFWDYIQDAWAKDENGKEIAFHVLGMQSQVARNMDAKHNRESPRLTKKLDEMSDEEKQEFFDRLQVFGKKAGAEKLAAMTVRIEGSVDYGEGEDAKKLTAKDKDLLTEYYMDRDIIAELVIAESKNIENYRPKT